MSHQDDQAFIEAKTMKTDFHTCTFMQSQFFVNDKEVNLQHEVIVNETSISFSYESRVKKNDTFKIHKFGGYVVDRDYDKNDLLNVGKKFLNTTLERVLIIY